MFQVMTPLGSGSTAIEVAMKHVFEQPPLLSDTVPSIPPAVEQVVMRALVKNPEERFMNIRDFAIALEKASSADTASVSQAPLQGGQLPSLGTPTTVSSENTFPTLS